MRILVVSNFYPPQFIGGYELGCRDVVEGLRARGHTVRILTSTYGVGGPQADGEVFRWLEASIDWKKGPRHLRACRRMAQHFRNEAALRRACRAFRPDLIYVWGISFLFSSVPFFPLGQRAPVCCFVSDAWPIYVKSNAQHRRGRRGRLKNWLTFPYGLTFRNVQFASDYLKRRAFEAGQPVAAGEVIHWGVDPADYAYDPAPRRPRRLLYVGQVMPHKGVHTAVEALGRVVGQPGFGDVTLTIAGGSVDAEYQAHVRDLVCALGLGDHVRFTGKLPRHDLRSLYRQHDVLIFPSVWDEPFGITPLEAMASGLAIVGTNTGGSPEMFDDGVNALVFPAGDADACADRVLRLLRDPALFDEIRGNGRRAVEERFSFAAMVDKIERSLLEIVGGGIGGRP